MKIASLRISNYQGIRAADINIGAPIVIVAGDNFAGKSSIGEAIRLALLNEPVRVKLKKEYGQLLRDGEKSGFIDLAGTDAEGAEWHCSMHLPTGKVAGAPPVHASAALPYVLNAQRFAHLSADERRTYLFAMMGLSIDTGTVRTRLAKRACDTDKIEQILPIVRAGFPAACDEAKGRAREAKGEWKAVTGETYGSDKAARWRPAGTPAFDPATLEIKQRARAAINAALDAARTELDGLNEQARDADKQQASLRDLREKSALEPRRRAKLDADAKTLSEAKAALAEMRHAAGEPPAKPTGLMSCPCCKRALYLDADKQLQEYAAPEPKPYDAEVAAAIPEYEHAVATAERAYTNSQRDHAEAENAGKALAAMGDILAAPDAKAVEEAQATVQRLSADVKELDTEILALEDHQREAEAYDRKLKDANRHAATVQAWERIAEALAPDGIPDELLREALGPINTRMAQSAADAQWLQPVISPAMDITATIATPGAGNRVTPYALLSESEQWRVDAIIAEAISHLTGIKLLVLDRMDVLNVQGRTDLLEWLLILADQREIDTAIIIGTLKAPPKPTEKIDVVWITNGVAAPPLARAA